MSDVHDARALAARVAARADLQEIRLFSIEGSLDELPQRGNLIYTFDASIQVQPVEEESIIVDGDYELLVRRPEPVNENADAADTDTQVDNETDVVKLKFKLAALYQLGDDYPDDGFSDKELDAFGQTTGQLTLHPYARELIANMTGRMGLPTLQIQVLKIPIDKPAGVTADT